MREFYSSDYLLIVANSKETQVRLFKHSMVPSTFTFLKFKFSNLVLGIMQVLNTSLFCVSKNVVCGLDVVVHRLLNVTPLHIYRCLEVVRKADLAVEEERE